MGFLMQDFSECLTSYCAPSQFKRGGVLCSTNPFDCAVLFFLFLFLIVLSLHCCGWAFSSCSEHGLLFFLIVVASLVAEYQP